MEILLKVAVILCIFLAVFLLAVSIDLKEVYYRVKQDTTRAVGKLEQVGARVNLVSRAINYTETIIQKSNIRLYMSYNVMAHFLICASFGIVALRWMSSYMDTPATLSFGAVVALTPYITLQVISDHFAKLEKKNAIDFLTIVKNCLINSKNDIFKAFKDVGEYTIIEPLKSFVNIMVYEYEHKVSGLTCLENFRKKISTPELKLWVDNLKICFVQGGDTLALTDTFIQEISNQDEDDDKQDTEDNILSYGLYMLLLLNFAIIYWIIHSSYKKEILGSLWGEAVFILDMLVSMYIIYMSMKRGGD